MTVSKLALNSGQHIPIIGLGVYKSTPGGETYNAVLSALKIGYRHVDTAQAYGNEEDVGRAVRDSGIPREDLFVTSKVWLTEWGFEKTAASIKASLNKLGLDYLDLMLLHAPGEPEGRDGSWKALEEAHAQGLIKSIGVSNFGIPHLEKLLGSCTTPPAVNQIELHPFLQRPELTKWCQAKGIMVEAYSPLAKAAKLQDHTVLAVASQLGKTAAQVLIRWSLQHGWVPLPKSVSPERQKSNLEVLDFELLPEQVARLDALNEGLVTGWDPIVNDPV